jgi:hypothetical protein
VIVVDEYLAIRALVGDLPADVPDDFLGIPVAAHWRLLQRLHSQGDGQLSQLLSRLPESDREALSAPHPHVLEILDPRPYLDEAARISARFGNTGWLVAEAVTAALHHGRQLWFGSERNVGSRLREIASELGIDVRIAR